MDQENTEPQQQRLKRVKRNWPQWLKSKHLIRGLFYLGPLVYRIVRFFRAVLDVEGE